MDGTTNFVEGRDDVTSINCVKDGKPFCATVGFPFKKRIISAFLGQVPKSEIFKSEMPDRKNKHIIGTEFRNNGLESKLYKTVLSSLNGGSYRVKSMGCNLMALLAGDVDIFTSQVFDIGILWLHYH